MAEYNSKVAKETKVCVRGQFEISKDMLCPVLEASKRLLMEAKCALGRSKRIRRLYREANNAMRDAVAVAKGM